MAARALLLLLLPACSTLHVLPGLGRSTLGKECSERCTFDATSQLATEPKHFIHAVMNETATLGLVSLPRKEATLYLTKARRIVLQSSSRPVRSRSSLTLHPQAAMESCVPGAVVETGAEAPRCPVLPALTRALRRRLHGRLLDSNHARAAEHGPL